MKQRGFFDETDRLKELSRLGDPLEKLNRTINWEMFRSKITKKRGKFGQKTFTPKKSF